MQYEREQQFLFDVLQRSGIATQTLLLPQFCEKAEQSDQPLSLSDTAKQVLQKMQPMTLYRLQDRMEQRYFCLLLPSREEPQALLIGPFLLQRPAPPQLLLLAEQEGIAPQQIRHCTEYLSTLPIVDADSPIRTMVHRFCELLWGRPSFAIVDVTGYQQMTEGITESALRPRESAEAQMEIVTLEKRYEFENEMIRAVSLGQLHRESYLFRAFSPVAFERRLSDVLRNAKNYMIIMNTLLRKAAESGGVHPMYLDRVSSDFAARIEALATAEEVPALMREMYRSYCRLVRRHIVGQYSPLVQKTILQIDYDLCAPLSLRHLAEQQKVSAGYLSGLFRRETGKTLSEYIRLRRLRYAAHLLAESDLQIQTVAQHCGILDVQYFSKLFRAYTGKSPREYRCEQRKSHEKK